MSKGKGFVCAPSHGLQAGDTISLSGTPPRWWRLWAWGLKKLGRNPGYYRRKYYVVTVLSATHMEIGEDMLPELSTWQRIHIFA